MATRQSTTKTPAKAEKENPLSDLKFTETKEFPTVTRISQASSQFIAPAEAMVKDGKSFKLADLDRDAANKVANNLRQIMKRVHNRSLSAVYNPTERSLYVRDGGPIKERANGSAKATTKKATATKK